MFFLFYSCSKNKNKPTDKPQKATFFSLIPHTQSQVNFENNVTEDLYFNFLNYSYIYNGGGVAVGDINNDGLDDVYFTSNQNSNKLYLNEGDFKFKDITDVANVKDDNGWSTGVTMIDINNDGWLDIYVCKSGMLKNPNLRQNKLYINQRNNTFTEEAANYGLNQHGFSTQAYFFDYDNDDDLDMYLVNHRADFNNNTSINPALQQQLTPEDSDHLFRNDNGKFVDITQQSGIANKAWGLSASIGDFNNDGWADVYVANDFLEPDFLYINNKNGTFTDQILSHFNHISTNSMGSDLADINNDMLPDLLVLDMMAEDRVRGKENMATMSTENFNLMVNSGYHHQYMSNVLQRNNGNGSFSEIGQLSGIAKTDWSWAPLIADFNNDGYNDVFVTNGIEHDLSNQDFRNQMRQNIMNRKRVTLEEAIAMMPSTKLNNYMFINNTDHTFDNVTDSYGFSEKVNSNGVAYADLDNDGDLDLIINNQSDKASIYKNNATKNYLKVSLEGPKNNRKAIGAKVKVYTKENQQIKEIYTSRGFQSSISHTLNFGLDDTQKIDSIKVIWNTSKEQLLVNIDTNKHLKLQFKNASNRNPKEERPESHFEIVNPSNLGIDYKHKAVNFNDYNVQLLLPQKQSTIDNALAIADVNNDGLDDFFVGNTSASSAVLYIQNTAGNFTVSNKNLFNQDKQFNDNNALFFDADNDKDMDLYVATGNYSLDANNPLQQDRLYINDGTGNFSKSNMLPKILTVTKAIASSDFDNDGDQDLFVGGRVIPSKYPNTPQSYLLENRNGKFIDITKENNKELKNIGLVNDAIFSDYDGDGDGDLIVVGEWMPISIFKNDKGVFNKAELPFNTTKGWFQTIKAIDIDDDGDKDYFVGNMGHNNKFHPSKEKPLHIYANYFDSNKSYDIALSKEYQGELFPVRGKECSSEQTPFLNEKFGTYKDFAKSTIVDVYGAENIKNALHLEASSFSSYFIKNNGNEDLELIKLPIEAQFGPTHDFEFLDVNSDGRQEIIGVGSIYDAEVETIRYDASKGFMLNYDTREFSALKDENFILDKEAKAIEKISIKGVLHLMILNANNQLNILRMNELN